MANLEAVHKGYNYQDIVSALSFSQGILSRPNEIKIDQKNNQFDVFDDLKLIFTDRSYAFQFKFSVDENVFFTLSDIKTEQRDLRIDHLIQSFLNDDERNHTEYLIVTTLLAPVDDLLQLLEPVHGVSKFGGITYKFKPSVLWPENEDFIWNLRNAFLFDRNSLQEFLNKLKFEFAALRPSFDMRVPGALERKLLLHLKESIGIGHFPNQNKEPFDVAINLINLAARVRQSNNGISIETIIHQIQLKIDFGKVSQVLPVDLDHFVNRKDVILNLIDLAKVNGCITIEGPPGAGKSWLVSRTLEECDNQNIPVLHHYCYIGPLDQNTKKRIDDDVFYGNLIAQLVELEPSLQDANKPFFSASRQAFLKMLNNASDLYESIFIVIDGLDHILRVLNQNPELSRVNSNIVYEISTWSIPSNVHLILSAQPGVHFEKFQSTSKIFNIPMWKENETLILLETFLPRMHGFNEELESAATLLHEKSGGNPLYLTYLIKGFVSTFEENKLTIETYLNEQIQILSNENISKYYEHLLSVAHRLGVEDSIIKLFGLIDFSLKPEDITQMFGPVFASPQKVKECLALLRPILNYNNSQGGFRIYHESFKRYVFDLFSSEGVLLRDALSPVVSWLEERGFYKDVLAYKFLILMLQRSERHQDVLALIKSDFVNESLTYGHHSKTIDNNLVQALDSCIDIEALPNLVMIWELRRAVYETFKGKLINSTLLKDYLWCVGTMRGWEQLSDSLLYMGEPTLDKEDGLAACQLCDEQGAVAPWSQYLNLDDPEDSERNLDYEFSRVIGLARTENDFLIRLKKFFLKKGEDTNAEYIKGTFRQILRIHGSSVAESLLNDLKNAPVNTKKAILFAFWEYCNLNNENERLSFLESELIKICHESSDANNVYQLDFNFRSFKFKSKDFSKFKIGLKDNSKHLDEKEFLGWLNEVIIYSHEDSSGMWGYLKTIPKTSWYNCWIHYFINTILILNDLSFSNEEKAEKINFQLQELSSFDKAFAGPIRACDLYSIRSFIHQSFAKALRFIKSTHHLSQFIDGLVLISKNTTTYFQRSPGGPLIHIDLVKIVLENVQDLDVLKKVQTQVQDLIFSTENHGEYYSTLAEQQFSLTRMYALFKDLKQASESFQKGCEYLAAYGERKDATIYELIDSLPALEHSEGAKIRANKVLKLLAAVSRHTDGKGTNRISTDWFKSVLKFLPKESLVLLGDTINCPDGFSSWLIDDDLDHIITVLNKKVDPLIVYGLEMGTRIDDSYSIDKDKGKIIIQMIQEKAFPVNTHSSLIAHLVEDSKRFDNKWIEELSPIRKFDEKYFKVPDGVSFPDASNYLGKDDKTDFYKSEVYLAILKSGTSYELDQALKKIRVISLANNEHSCSLATVVGYRLCRFLSDNNFQEYQRYVDCLDSNLEFSKKAFFWEYIGDGLSRYGFKAQAVEAYVLCHCRTRGGGGWFELGGKDTTDVLLKSFLLDRNHTFQKYIYYLIEKAKGPGYGIGLSSTVIDDLITLSFKDLSLKCWDFLYEVILNRLPSKINSNGIYAHDLTNELSFDLDEAAAYLVLCLINHAEDNKKQAAIYTFSQLVLARKTSLISPLKIMFRVNTPVLSIAIFLGILEELDDGFLVGHLKDDLVNYVNIDHFYISRTSQLLLNKFGFTSTLKNNSLLSINKFNPREVDPTTINLLDWGSRFQSLFPLAPSVPSILTTMLNEKLNDESFKRLCQDRYEFFQSREAKKPTPALMWENEVFDQLLNQVLSTYSVFEHFDEHSKKFFEERVRQILMPSFTEDISYYMSRILRPSIDLPISVASNDTVKLLVVKDEEYKDWIICGRVEKQLVSTKRYYPPDDLRINFQGIIFYSKNAPVNMLPIAFENVEWFDLEDTLSVCQIFTTYTFTKSRDLLQFNSEMCELFQLDLIIDLESIFYQDKDGKKVAVFRQWSSWYCDNDASGKKPILVGCELIMEPQFWNDVKEKINLPYLFRTYSDSVRNLRVD